MVRSEGLGKVLGMPMILPAWYGNLSLFLQQLQFDQPQGHRQQESQQLLLSGVHCQMEHFYLRDINHQQQNLEIGAMVTFVMKIVS